MSKFEKKVANKLKNKFFILAAGKSYHALADILIKSGADIDTKDTRRGHFGNTALRYAIENEDIEAVKYIVEKNPESLLNPDHQKKNIFTSCCREWAFRYIKVSRKNESRKLAQR